MRTFLQRCYRQLAKAEKLGLADAHISYHEQAVPDDAEDALQALGTLGHSIKAEATDPKATAFRGCFITIGVTAGV